jgi:hypothetical protein
MTKYETRHHQQDGKAEKINIMLGYSYSWSLLDSNVAI